MLILFFVYCVCCFCVCKIVCVMCVWGCRLCVWCVVCYFCCVVFVCVLCVFVSLWMIKGCFDENSSFLFFDMCVCDGGVEWCDVCLMEIVIVVFIVCLFVWFVVVFMWWWMCMWDERGRASSRWTSESEYRSVLEKVSEVMLCVDVCEIEKSMYEWLLCVSVLVCMLDKKWDVMVKASGYGFLSSFVSRWN